MVEIILWSVLWGLAGVWVGFFAGCFVCKRRQSRKRTASTADSFLRLLRH
ncbi:MAG: hypothetical protein IJW98_00080 [Clostridia bacterium]|nr:hypothetical protein [Clostridia bacterium]